MISVIIKDYEFQTIIGVLEFERHTPQKVRINAEFQSDDFIDYVEVTEIIKSTYDEEKFELVEKSLQVCAKILKQKFPSLKYLKMEILKMEILKNCLVGAKIELKY